MSVVERNIGVRQAKSDIEKEIAEMIVERAEITVVAGREAEFAAVMAERGRSVLAAAPGCISVRIGRGVETPSMFILLLEWDSVASHVAFTKTPAFDAFKTLVGPLFAGPSNMAHFELF